jgi:hypothetical protein
VYIVRAVTVNQIERLLYVITCKVRLVYTRLSLTLSLRPPRMHNLVGRNRRPLSDGGGNHRASSVKVGKTTDLSPSTTGTRTRYVTVVCDSRLPVIQH